MRDTFVDLNFSFYVEFPSVLSTITTQCFTRTKRLFYRTRVFYTNWSISTNWVKSATFQVGIYTYIYIYISGTKKTPIWRLFCRHVLMGIKVHFYAQASSYDQVFFKCELEGCSGWFWWERFGNTICFQKMSWKTFWERIPKYWKYLFYVKYHVFMYVVLFHEGNNSWTFSFA